MSRATKSVMVRGHAARRNVLAPGVQLSGCAGSFLRSIFTHLYCRVRRIPHLTRSIEFIRTHPRLPLYSFNDQLTHHSCFYPAASMSGWIHRNIKFCPPQIFELRHSDVTHDTTTPNIPLHRFATPHLSGMKFHYVRMFPNLFADESSGSPRFTPKSDLGCPDCNPGQMVIWVNSCPDP